MEEKRFFVKNLLKQKALVACSKEESKRILKDPSIGLNKTFVLTTGHGKDKKSNLIFNGRDYMNLAWQKD